MAILINLLSNWTNYQYIKIGFVTHKTVFVLPLHIFQSWDRHQQCSAPPSRTPIHMYQNEVVLIFFVISFLFYHLDVAK
jgi:hypothetical protein